MKIDNLITNLIGDFNPKHRRVIEGRFGLRTGKRATLQKIGDDLGITRERVRQIEEQGMIRLQDRIQSQASDLLKNAEIHLASVGGVKRDDFFLQDIKHILGGAADIKYPETKLRFLLLMGGKPFYSKEDDTMHDFWYSNESAKEKFLNFVKKITKFLEANDKKAVLDKKIHLAECKDLHSCHLISIPKHFAFNVFGDFGLKDWPEIEPKTVRDKAYLVLRKHGQPLHFVDIAKNINQYGIDRKPAHIQTVHNELIKDNRFVLVGRGMYALSEHGFEAGTVREVIGRLLKQKGPLKAPEVVRLVNQKRILKENTILLSLQNRRHFERLSDGRYNIREA